jgi:hypothetical protein
MVCFLDTSTGKPHEKANLQSYLCSVNGDHDLCM